jgi:hypothetical protein
VFHPTIIALAISSAVNPDSLFGRLTIPALVSEIKTIFEPWQLAEFLEIAK